jgi:peptidyl-prolyl cis-trans isomerase SurA
MDNVMSKAHFISVVLGRALRVAATAAVLGCAFLPTPGRAQVVVVANGSPITELDIQQRTKLIASSTQKTPTRQEVIQELIDDRIKIAKARVYGLEVSDRDVDSAFESMASRQHITPAQFAQVLERNGIAPAAVKARVRAELTWNQLVRGKFGSSLQISETDIADAMKDSKDANAQVTAYNYTLYPVTVLVPRGSSPGVVQAKRQEAENLRGRFTACNQGLALARSLRDIAVREPVSRSSADLPPQLRDMLGSMEVGHLTAPEVTPQGLQMFAVCAKRESTTESPAKKQAREQLFNKRFEAESKKYLEEIRKQAMIEYK